MCRTYADFRPSLPDQLLAVLISSTAGEAQGGLVAVDLGCGSSSTAARLASSGRFQLVVGIDPSAAQIEAAPVHGKVRYHVGTSENFSDILREDHHLEHGSVDLLCAGTCLHWFSDVTAFAESASKWLKPASGLLAVWVYFHSTIAESEAASRVIREFVDSHLSQWPPQAMHARNKFAELMPMVLEGGSLGVRAYHEADAVVEFTSVDDYMAYIGTWSGCVLMAQREPERYKSETSVLRERLQQEIASASGEGKFHLVTKHFMWLLQHDNS